MRPTLDELIHDIQDANPDPLLQLDAASAAAVELNDLGDALLNHFVDRCRRSGHSWADIGEHLGVTRQAVQKRFVDRSGAGIPLDRFTPRTRVALDHARTEAHRLGHNLIGPEHLLLGMLDVEECLAAQIVTAFGVTHRAVVRRINEVVAAPLATLAADEIAYAPRARRALDEAVAFALELGHNFIGTEHVLVGIYRVEGLAATILTDRGVTDEALREAVVDKLNQAMGGPPRSHG